MWEAWRCWYVFRLQLLTIDFWIPDFARLSYRWVLCDITLTSTSFQESCDNLNEYIPSHPQRLACLQKNMTDTLFTTWNRGINTTLQIRMGGKMIPTDKKPKIQYRNNIIKAPAGNSWDKDKEELVTTYKSIVRSVHRSGHLLAKGKRQQPLSWRTWKRLRQKQQHVFCMLGYDSGPHRWICVTVISLRECDSSGSVQWPP